MKTFHVKQTLVKGGELLANGTAKLKSIISNYLLSLHIVNNLTRCDLENLVNSFDTGRKNLRIKIISN